MKDFIKRQDTFNMHRKVKEVAQIYRKRIPMTFIDDTNRIIVDEKEMMNMWESHVSKLFRNIRPDKDHRE